MVQFYKATQMEEVCAKCKQICKRLEADDEPKHYLFSHLKPEEVIQMVEAVVKDCQGKYLHLIDTAQSDGHQLAVMLKATEPECNKEVDHCVVFISQATYDAEGYTDMWIRYGTPPELCDSLAVVCELTLLIEHILSKLFEADRSARDSFLKP